MRRLLIAMLLLVGLFAPASGASAALVGFEFDATVAGADPSMEVPIGTLFTVSVTYDPTAPNVSQYYISQYYTGDVRVALPGTDLLYLDGGLLNLAVVPGSYSEFRLFMDAKANTSGANSALLIIEFASNSVFSNDLGEFDPLSLNDPTRLPFALSSFALLNRGPGYSRTLLSANVGSIRLVSVPEGRSLTALAIAVLAAVSLRRRLEAPARRDTLRCGFGAP